MKDSEDSLLNKIKDLSEKLDAKRTGLSNIQWTNDLAVLKSCLEDVDKIQADINLLAVSHSVLILDNSITFKSPGCLLATLLKFP